jgi:hypothetical protein
VNEPTSIATRASSSFPRKVSRPAPVGRRLHRGVGPLARLAAHARDRLTNSSQQSDRTCDDDH